MPKKWDEQSVISILIDLYKKNGNKPFNVSFLRKNGYDSVRVWLYSNYGSPFEFCKKHNLSHIIKNGRTSRKWTEERIVTSIKEAYNKKGSPVYDKWLNSNGYSTPLSRLKKDGYSLYTFAAKHNILDLIEVKYKANGYTEDELKDLFIKLHEKLRIPLCDAVLSENGFNKHVSYIRNHFGGLDEFVVKNGLTDIFEKRYSPLSEEEVIYRVRKLNETLGRNLCMKDIQENLAGCAGYIYRKYGNFESFCRENSLMEIYDYKGGVSWDDDIAADIIKSLSKKYGRKISYSDLKMECLHGLIHYIRNNFNGVSDFISKLGLDNYMFVSDKSNAFDYGIEFEKLTKKCFEVLGFNFVYQARYFVGIVPDFYFPDSDTIIDTKISSYTPFNTHNDFFDKYTKHCSNLIVLYLRGPDINHKDGKITFRCIKEYYPLLKGIGRQDIINEFETLRDKFESMESEAS